MIQTDLRGIYMGWILLAETLSGRRDFITDLEAAPGFQNRLARPARPDGSAQAPTRGFETEQL
jgi:hypothetical protein